MSDNPDGGKVKESGYESARRVAINEQEKKGRVRIEAEKVIYSCISKWAGKPVAVGEAVPIMRNGQDLRRSATPTILGGVPEVKRILDVAALETYRALKNQKQRLEKATEAIGDMIETVSKLTFIEKQSLTPISLLRRGCVEENVIVAVGCAHALGISSHLASVEITKMVVEVEEKLENYSNSPGAKKVEVRYQVAKEMARLYARVTGEKPTYSEDKNGVYGKFTPALRDVFTAFGWKKSSLKNPAKAALKAISEEDLKAPQTKVQILNPLGF